MNNDEKRIACEIARRAGATHVKTSTGFAYVGATIEDVLLLRETVGPDFGVKAAGGIRSYRDAMALLEAGADRLGTSAGVRILAESPEEPTAVST